MPANRISSIPGHSTAANSSGPETPIFGAAFMILVASPEQQAAWQQVYRLAMERARQALELPLHHRHLFSNWN
jgi:hypothetical protein